MTALFSQSAWFPCVPAAINSAPGVICTLYSGLPERYSGLPERYSSLPERYSSFPEQYSSPPERYSSLPERYSSLPERYSSFPEQYSSLPERSSSLSGQSSRALFYIFSESNRTPNNALQRTGGAVTPAASCLRLSPTAQRSRQPRRSLSLGSLGV